MGDLSAALPAIAQCVSNGAKVVDISLAGGFSSTFESALRDHYDNDGEQ